MNIDKYSFDTSILQEPIEAFLAQYRAMVDLNDVNLITTARREADVFREPNDSELPEVRIVANTLTFPSISIPATFDQCTVILSHYFYWRDDSTDWQLNGLNFMHYVLRRLQGSQTGVTDAEGIQTSDNWEIDYQNAKVVIEYTDVFERYHSGMRLAPPYRAARLDIPVCLAGTQL